MPNANNDYQLERYKYVLSQIQTLNSGVFKYLGLFQALATAIIGAVAALLLAWQEFSLDPDMTKVSIRGLLGLLTILGVYTVVSITAGIFSWVDYRREETRILNEAIRPGYRDEPNIGNFWRWYEFYFVLFTIIVVVAIWVFTEAKLFPLIHSAPT